MLQELAHNLRRYLDHFFDLFPHNQAEPLLTRLASCQGMIFLTGAGKSGHIAQKIAATFTSTGTKATFLCPHQAVHGALGLITSNDLVLLFSKSGETEELLNLLTALKKREVFTVAIVSAPHSRLSQTADYSILLPVQRELCPYDLAPTTSTMVQLIFGYCLSVALMQRKNFSISDFASNHPSGLIGRKIGFTVSDLMLCKHKLPLCQTGDRLIDMLHELSTKKCGCLLVEEKGKLLGIFTDGDLRRTIQTLGTQGITANMGQLMTRQPRTITPDQLALDALHCMEQAPSPITALPVIQGETLVGLIRMHDILQTGLHKE